MVDFMLWFLESSLLILFVLGIRKIFSGKISYRAIYALWLVVVFRFMIPVNIIPTPFGFADNMKKSLDHLELELSTAANNPAAIPQKAPNFTLQKSANKSIGDTEITANNTKDTTVEHNNVLTNSEETHSLNTPQKQERSRDNSLSLLLLALPIKQIAMTIWGIGTVLLLLCFVLSNRHMTKQLHKYRVFISRVGNLDIFAVDTIPTPCLYGLRHPAIYIPSFLLDEQDPRHVSPNELRHIIAHESVHYQHKDYIWSILRMALLTVYWFNPLAWIASSCSKKDAELYCDETVLQQIGSKQRFEYGNLLIKLAAKPMIGVFCYSVVPMSRKGREMERRIKELSCPQKRYKWLILPMFLLLLFGIVITCSTGTGLAVKSKATETSSVAINETLAQVYAQNFYSHNFVMNSLSEKSFAEQALTINTSSCNQSNASFANVLLASNNVSNTITVEDTIDATDYKLCESLFRRYVSAFTNAINTGNTKFLKTVLAADAYHQQSSLAKNYYKRGIRENAKSLEVTSEQTTDQKVYVLSNEKIYVCYADQTQKLIKQRYRYTCEKIDGQWFITEMSDIE